MARSVGSVSIAVWYIPDIDDNRESEDPFRVLLTPLSGEEMRALTQRIVYAPVKKGKVANDGMRAQRLQDEAIRLHVLDVRGYSVSTPDGVVTPKNGAELIEAVKLAPSSELAVLNDIADAILDHSKLAEGILKK